MLERRGDRYYFTGRRDGVINVGGMKVHPEEVEAVINRHPQVRMSLVRTRKSPITGALVVADVVLKAGLGSNGEPLGRLEGEILQFCHQVLPSPQGARVDLLRSQVGPRCNRQNGALRCVVSS